MTKATRFSRLTFGRAMRRERENLRLSQEKFAERADVHRTYISSVELGSDSTWSIVKPGIRSYPPLP